MGSSYHSEVRERLDAFRAQARAFHEEWLAILDAPGPWPGSVTVEALGLVARLSALAARADQILEAGGAKRGRPRTSNSVGG